MARIDTYFGPLSALMKAGVDIFVYTPDEFKKMKNTFFIKRAFSEGIKVFESGKL